MMIQSEHACIRIKMQKNSLNTILAIILIMVSSHTMVKVTECDNNFSITTRDLSLSLGRAASTAQTFGVSLDELLGYTTAIGRLTIKPLTIVILC